MKPFSTRIPADIVKSIKEYAKYSGKKIWCIVAEAIEQYLSKKKT